MHQLSCSKARGVFSDQRWNPPVSPVLAGAFLPTGPRGKSSLFICNVLCLVVSCIQLFVTPWTVTTRRAPLSMGLSRQEYCSGLPCPPPGDLPHPGIQPRSPTLQADSLPGKPLCIQQCDSFKLLCSNFSPLGFCDTVLFLMFLIILCSS